MNNLGAFMRGFAPAFKAIKDQKEQKDEQKKEKDARLKLFEIEMTRAKRQEAEAEQQSQSRNQFFSKMQPPMDDVISRINDPSQGPLPPGKSLTDMLADPEGMMLALQGGMAKATDFIAKPKDEKVPDSIALLQALAADPALAEVDRKRRAASASQVNVGDQGMTRPPAGYFRPDPKAPGLTVEPGGPVDAELKLKQKEIKTALDVYEEAKAGLLKGLNETYTGPLIGGFPALTNNTQVADSSIASMTPVLKQIFRAAGEGVFTDKDQAALIAMIPTRIMLPEARAIQMQNIDNIIRAKLGMGPRATEGQKKTISFSELPD